MEKKIFAFTLAEVLVTLAILGVVASVILPPLLGNYNKKVYATQLKKVYSEMSQSLTKYMNDEKALDLIEAGLTPTGGSVQNFVNKNFKTIKNCQTSGSGCFADNYRTLNGTSVTYPVGGDCFVTSNGTSMCITIYNTSKTSDSGIGYVYVDVNGKEEPNILGRDAFAMIIYPDATLDKTAMRTCKDNPSSCQYGNGTNARTNCKNACKNAQSWYDSSQCFGALLDDNWEMKY